MQIVKPPADSMVQFVLDPEQEGSPKVKMTVQEFEKRFRKGVGAAAPAAASGPIDFTDFNSWKANRK